MKYTRLITRSFVSLWSSGSACISSTLFEGAVSVGQQTSLLKSLKVARWIIQHKTIFTLKMLFAVQIRIYVSGRHWGSFSTETDPSEVHTALETVLGKGLLRHTSTYRICMGGASLEAGSYDFLSAGKLRTHSWIVPHIGIMGLLMQAQYFEVRTSIVDGSRQEDSSQTSPS